MYYKLVKDQPSVSSQDFKVFLHEESKVCHTPHAKNVKNNNNNNLKIILKRNCKPMYIMFPLLNNHWVRCWFYTVYCIINVLLLFLVLQKHENEFNEPVALRELYKYMERYFTQVWNKHLAF